MALTEFQRKTYEKVRNDILAFIPDDLSDIELDAEDIMIMCATAVNKLSEKELDSLLCIGTIPDKKGVITQRFFDMIMHEANAKEENEDGSNSET